MTTTERSKGAERERNEIRDPAVLRALAHPARLALLEHLAQSPDGVTATECATVVGLSPSATSYHLRALAKAGIISEAPSRGDGRERVWQVTQSSYELSGDPQASAELIAAEEALVETLLARQNDKVRRFLAVARQGEPEWYHASVVGDSTLVATVAELKHLVAQIEELTRPLRARNRPTPPKDARRVSFQIRAVPADQPE